jgi:DNA-directed RNA polymerase specialized sigma24 family protein
MSADRLSEKVHYFYRKGLSPSQISVLLSITVADVKRLLSDALNANPFTE